jgi:hypothetical protein
MPSPLSLKGLGYLRLSGDACSNKRETFADCIARFLAAAALPALTRLDIAVRELENFLDAYRAGISLFPHEMSARLKTLVLEMDVDVSAKTMRRLRVMFGIADRLPGELKLVCMSRLDDPPSDSVWSAR